MEEKAGGVEAVEKGFPESHGPGTWRLPSRPQRDTFGQDLET